jgi:hypothetical protein
MSARGEKRRARGVQEKILKRIEDGGRGAVYTSKDFLDLGDRAAVDQVLSRLAREGVLRRLRRGLYDYPRVNVTLGIELSPDGDAVALALARATGSRIQMSGALAANVLGLTTQVPAQRVYLTDGGPRTVRLGSQTLVFKRVAAKELIGCGKVSGMVFQALRHLGRDAVNNRIIEKLRGTLSEEDRRQLAQDAAYGTDWIREAVQAVTREEAEDEHRGEDDAG